MGATGGGGGRVIRGEEGERGAGEGTEGGGVEEEGGELVYVHVHIRTCVYTYARAPQLATCRFGTLTYPT